MKKLVLGLFLFASMFHVVAQKLTVGIENGINFSNIHQSIGVNRLDGLPGPVNGIFLKFEPISWLVVQSGINHTSINYFQQNYHDFSDDIPSNQLSGIIPSFSYRFENQGFNLLRIPLLLKIKTVGRMSMEFGGGLYYSIVTNDAYRGKDREIRNPEYINSNFPPLNDWGSILAGSLNYQIDDRWSVFVAGQVTNAQSVALKEIGGKIGSSEFTFGIGYSPFLHNENFKSADSIVSKIALLPHSGMLFSAVKTSIDDKYYKKRISFAAGVSAKLLLNQTFSVISGVWFERKGYNLEYSGTNNFIYLPQKSNESQNLNQLSSDIDLDYLTFPVMIGFSVGRKFNSSLNMGIYYSWLQNAGCQGEMNEKYIHQSGYNITRYFFKNDIDKYFKNFDAGMLFGYRLDWKIFKGGGLFLGVNQSVGLVNLFENLSSVQNTTDAIDNLKLFNRSTTIVAGVNVPISK